MSITATLWHAHRVRLIKRKIRRLGVGTYKPGNSSRPGHLYNPLPFAALSDVPAQRESCAQRFDVIRDHLPLGLRSGRVLDLGCNVGFNSFKFAELGFECVGVELDPLTAEIASDVAALYDVGVRFVCAEATPELVDGLGRFDVALFLASFQWITKARGFEFACEVLRTVQRCCDVMFFETSMGNEGRAKMPMLPDGDAVEQMLTTVGVHSYVDRLADVTAPNAWLGKTRCLFRTQATCEWPAVQ